MRKLLFPMGLLSIGLGVAIVATSSPTGAVIGGAGDIGAILGAILVIGGIAAVAMSGLEKTVAEEHEKRDTEHVLNSAGEYLQKNRYIRDTRKLRRLAQECGYIVEAGYREGYRVINEDGHWITTIPNHRGDLPTGTARSIMESLASGKVSGRYARDLENAIRKRESTTR